MIFDSLSLEYFATAQKGCTTYVHVYKHIHIIYIYARTRDIYFFMRVHTYNSYKYSHRPTFRSTTQHNHCRIIIFSCPIGFTLYYGIKFK